MRLAQMIEYEKSYFFYYNFGSKTCSTLMFSFQESGEYLLRNLASSILILLPCLFRSFKKFYSFLKKCIYLFDFCDQIRDLGWENIPSSLN